MKKFRHLWLSILTLILSVSIIIGGAGLSAFAEPDTTGTPIITTPVVLPTSVDLGKEIDLGNITNVSVTAPDGSSVTPSDKGEGSDATKYVVAAMLGNYVINYGETTQYTHIVNVKLADEYELRVVSDGADIPTYTDKDAEYTLPKAVLYKKGDKDDEYTALKSSDFELKVYVNNKEQNIDQKIKFAAGKNTVQYVARLAGTDKCFTKQYDVNSQIHFKDDIRPSISISGVPSEASLNTKVTLPKATATDNFDTNVKVAVTVRFGNDTVYKATVNEYGYADGYADKDGNKLAENGEKVPVEFDNVYEMSFYPREIGTYTVEYQAIDDKGNSSVKQPFNIKVQDRTAPKLEKIADDQIPSTWGIQNTVASGTTAKDHIVFPYPDYSDNNTAKDAIKVSFEIRHSLDNKTNTVIRFDNIYDYKEDGTAGDGAKYAPDSSNTSKGLYKEAATFKKDGFDFYFGQYTSALENDVTKTGTYTVVYNATDGKNTTTKSYDIVLQDTFTDNGLPAVEIDADKYWYVNNVDTAYTLPTATVSDAVDSRPTVKYLVKFGSEDAKKEVKVENGAEISVRCDNEKFYFTYDEKVTEEDITKVDALEIVVEATDDLGNVGKNKETKIQLAYAKDLARVDLGIARDVTGATADADIKTNTPVNLGKVTVGPFDKAYRDFVGFEVYVENSKGIVTGIDLETYVQASDDNRSIIIDNIKFTPARASEKDVDDPDNYIADYKLVVRAFDVSGRSTAKSFAFAVKSNDAGGGDPIEKALEIPSSGKIMVAYRLRNESFDNAVNAKTGIVTKISGAGRFSLMKTEFTAYTAGTVSFTDGYYNTSDEFVTIAQTYTFNADDNSNTVFEAAGPVPVLFDETQKAAIKKDDEGTWLKFPKFVAYNEYANATISVKLTTPNGRTYSYDPDDESSNTQSEGFIYYDAATREFRFFTDTDGEYTIDYSASVGSSSVATQSYKVRVGDTVPPSFTVSGTEYGETARQNFKFQFKKITLDDVDRPDIKDITFKKVLKDPSGNEVYSVSGEGSAGADKQTPSKDETYSFSMTGDYTVEYTATDKAGNSSVYQDIISVSATDSTNAMPLKVLRTVLIIVGVILIAGVILYFIRFRKVKAD